MMTHIRTVLNQLEFSDLMDKIPDFNCHVSLFHGRKFTLEECEGDVSFNEIVYTVYQEALHHSGELKGLEIYQTLLDVHQMGEQELQTKPWWVRIVTLLKRCFTFWKREHYLNYLQECKDFHELSSYYSSRSHELFKALQESGLNITQDQLYFYSKSSEDNEGSIHREIHLTIKIPLLKESRNYQGLEAFEALLNVDEVRNLDTQFQEFMQGVQQTFPRWLEYRKEMDSVAMPMRQHIQQRLIACKSEKEREGCQLEDLELSLKVSLSDPISWLYTGKIKFLKTLAQTEEHREFQLPAVTWSDVDQKAFADLKKEWLAFLDEKMDLFLKRSIENPPLTAQQEITFKQIVEEDFFNYFEEDFFENDQDLTLEKISEYVTTMETITNEPLQLLSLLNEKKKTALQDALKELWKKAAFQFHPCMAKSREEQDKKTEHFKNFVEAYLKTLQWLSEQQIEKNEHPI